MTSQTAYREPIPVRYSANSNVTWKTWESHSEAGDISCPTVKTGRNICTFMKNSECLGTSFCVQNVLKWKYKVKVPKNYEYYVVFHHWNNFGFSPLGAQPEGTETHSPSFLITSESFSLLKGMTSGLKSAGFSCTEEPLARGASLDGEHPLLVRHPDHL